MRRSSFVSFVVFSLICGLGGVALFGTAMWRAPRDRDREVAAARAEGLPTEPADLDRMVAVPDSQNAAPLYARAFALAGESGPLEGPLSQVAFAIVSPPLRPADAERTHKAYLKLPPLLRLAHRIAALPHADFHLDWRQGPGGSPPDAVTINEIARALEYDAERRSAAGDWKGSLESLRDAQRIGLHLGEDPTVVGMLIQGSIEETVHASLLRIANEQGRNPEFVAEALEFVRHMGPLPNLKRALKGELVLSRASLADVGALLKVGPKTRSATPTQERILQSPPMRAPLDTRLVHAFRELIRSMPDDPAQWETADKRRREFDARNEADDSMLNAVNRIVFPPSSAAAILVGETIMLRRLTETSLLLLQERTRRGSFPTRLPDYGEVGIDPFSGSPLVFRRTETGFTLNSVGRYRMEGEGLSRSPLSGEPANAVVRFR